MASWEISHSASLELSSLKKFYVADDISQRNVSQSLGERKERKTESSVLAVYLLYSLHRFRWSVLQLLDSGSRNSSGH